MIRTDFMIVIKVQEHLQSSGINKDKNNFDRLRPRQQ